MSAALEITCPRCREMAITDECGVCKGEHTVRVEPVPRRRDMTPEIPDSAVARVESRIARLLALHCVPGSAHRARTAARALCWAPPERELAAHVAALCGCGDWLAAIVVHETVLGLLAEARLRLAAVRYVECAQPAARELATRLCCLGERLERALPTYDQRADVLADLRWP
jgi:hypothetical protein